MACGGFSLEVGVLAFRDEAEGVKAEERTVAMDVGDQVVVMLSRKWGESRMKTSEGSRRPRRAAEVWSSWRRVGPRFSASPDVVSL